MTLSEVLVVSDIRGSKVDSLKFIVYSQLKEFIVDRQLRVF